MKTIAIVCDCDNTLTHDSTSLLIKSNGIDVDQFWKKIDGMAVSYTHLRAHET